MPVPLPNLDDRTTDDLVEEGKRLISSLAPSWTDHNPSDPGITLIEVFAFLAEMLIYRADRVSAANKQVFLRLLRVDPDYSIQHSIDEEIRLAVLNLRDEQRAVTPGDFRSVAESVPGVGRAYCLPRRNVESSPLNDAPAHISLLIVPREISPGKPPVVGEELRELVRKALIPRCLLTTRVHVAAPIYISISVNIIAYVFADQNEDAIKEQIKSQLATHFDPLSGGSDGHGWPFGQSVYISELYAFLDTVEGVDYVEPKDQQPVLKISIGNSPGHEIREGSQTIGLRLGPHELVWFDRDNSVITVVRQATVIP
jgi:hypothetical protein